MSVRVGHKNFRAFTLVELLVVIGIIALLIAILLPTLTRVQASAKLVACKANMRVLLQGHALYGLEFKDSKPPLWKKKTLTTQVDMVSPDVKWGGTPVGQGILVDRKLVSLRNLMCPAAEMVEDVRIDTDNWPNSSLIRSGSSYVYFYRWADSTLTPATFCKGVTYNAAARRGHRVMLMDISADESHPLEGEYATRRWVSHKVLGKVNLGCVDGSVREAAAGEIRLQYPFLANEEQQWFADASKLVQ